MNYKLPLEQRTKDEAEVLKSTWNTGAFHFLIQRTEEKFKLKINKTRRSTLEAHLNTHFPVITDEMLLFLYKIASQRYMNFCKSNHDQYSGFQTTPHERVFLANIESIISTHPKLKHLEISPSHKHHKDLPTNFKMVIGNYVPDFVVFGLKTKNSSAIVFEINGDSHLDKYSKDELRFNHLKELKVATIEIPNDKVNDINYLTKTLLDTYRLRNGSFNDQIQRVKRRIWLKTICCQLSLNEIETYVQSKFNIQLNLLKEAQHMIQLSDCPRLIKKELLKLKIHQYKIKSAHNQNP